MGKRQWLSTGEVAAELGVSVTTVVRLCQAGWLHYERTPIARSHRRIPRWAVERYKEDAAFLRTYPSQRKLHGD